MYTGYEKVLERLLEERLNVGMEQDEIASIIGVTQSNYSKTERGMRRFSYFQVIIYLQEKKAQDIII